MGEYRFLEDVALADCAVDIEGRSLDDLFETIVDIHAVAPYCKPMPESFAIAQELADEPDPRKCVMIDDLPRTTRAALDAGMASILYGTEEPTPEASGTFKDWAHLPILLG